MSLSTNPWNVVVFYDGTNKDGDDAEVLFNDVVLAPSREIALMLGGWEVPEGFRSVSKAVRLRISANPL